MSTGQGSDTLQKLISVEFYTGPFYLISDVILRLIEFSQQQFRLIFNSKPSQMMKL